MEDWARRCGAPALRLAVMPGKEPAVTLYRRHGFVDTDQLGDLLSDGVVRARFGSSFRRACGSKRAGSDVDDQRRIAARLGIGNQVVTV